MFSTEMVGPKIWHIVEKIQVTRSHKSSPVQPVAKSCPVLSCQTYCWGSCGTDAAVARLLAGSLAFPEASFTGSLSSRWCVSPASTDKDTHGRWARCLEHCWLQIQHRNNRSESKKALRHQIDVFFDKVTFGLVRAGIFWTHYCY